MPAFSSDLEGLPRIVDDLELLVPIACGGMAAVYLAVQKGPGGFERECAVKGLHPHLCKDAEWVLSLLEEAKLAARIRHPHVVQVLAVREERGVPYLLMEYVEGDSLSGLIRLSPEGRLPRPVALRILCDALKGLHAAHEQRDEHGALVGLVHRDVSPHNVMVGLDGIGRLTDFGIAKATSRHSFTRTGTIKGKVAYMAPEQLAGGEVDRRCDVWAAGVVAWELLAGTRLYSQREEVVALSILHERAPRLRAIDRNIPKGLDDAVASALVHDARKRCPSADELRQRLASAAPMASSEEVAAYVRDATEVSREQMRLRIVEARSRRRPSGVAPASVASPHKRDAAGASDSGDPSAVVPTRRRSRMAMFALVAAIGGVAAALAFLLPGLRTPAASDNRPESSAAAQAQIASACIADQRNTSTAPPNEAAVPVTVHADSALSRLRLGSREIHISHPAKAITVPVLEEEAAVDVEVEAATRDGRVTLGTLRAGTRELTLTFPPPARRGARPKVPQRDAPTLARDPY